MIRRYGPVVRLADIEAVEPADWDVTGATHVRVVLAANPATELAMQRRGFILADRTLKTSISLGRCTVDLGRLIRLPVVETAQYKEDILHIACASFTADRRFHITPDCNPEIAAYVLREWVETLDETLVCLFKGRPVGFLALKADEADALFVYLAAVEERYRMTGAAMSLYARACQLARERGYKRLEGRVSSLNTAVMNVYAAFGAMFSEPQDVFLREVEHDA